MSARDTVVEGLPSATGCLLSVKDIFFATWFGQIVYIWSDSVNFGLIKYISQFLSSVKSEDFYFQKDFWAGHKKVTLRGVPVVVLPFLFLVEQKLTKDMSLASLYGEVKNIMLHHFFTGMADYGYLYGEETSCHPQWLFGKLNKRRKRYEQTEPMPKVKILGKGGDNDEKVISCCFADDAGNSDGSAR